MSTALASRLTDTLIGSIFEKCTKNDLREFISKWATLQEIDQTKAFDLACAAMKY